MRSRSLVPSIAVLVLVTSVVACSDSATAPLSPAPSPDASFQTEATTDLAPSAGEDAANDYEFLAAASSSSTVGASFSLAAPAPGGLVSASVNAPPSTVAAEWISPSCTFSATTGRFACPAVAKKGHIYSVSYALADANGVTQSKYDKVTTASINFIVADTGAVSFANNGNTFADTSSRHKNMTVSGLQGDPDTVHTWNGYGSGAIRSVRSGQITKIYQLASTDTVTGVRFKQPRDINPYPLSGTVVRNYTVIRLREASDTTKHTATRRVVVTFNGSANVPLVVTNGDGTTTSFTLNLDTHKTTKP